jgi:hypothetical protein
MPTTFAGLCRRDGDIFAAAQGGGLPMTPQGLRWQRVAGLTVALCLAAAGYSRAQLFRPFTDHSRALLEGNWQSCREGDGQYGERVYDGKWPGLPPFELHMGPYHDFALFRGIQEEHRDHAAPENLLKPHTLEIQGNMAKHSWDADGLHLEVVLAGGSREDCESWFVTLKRAETTVSH